MRRSTLRPSASFLATALAVATLLASGCSCRVPEVEPVSDETQVTYSTDEQPMSSLDLVEAAVLREFERLSERGGVLGAMETQYQRSQIQEESLHYESLKHSGDLPIIGVNTFENPNPEETHSDAENLVRSTEQEKRGQLAGLAAFHRRWQPEAPGALAELQATALREENVFAELMETVKTASLGQIADALFEVGGRYRRSM